VSDKALASVSGAVRKSPEREGLRADPNLSVPISKDEATLQAQRNIDLLNLDDTIDTPRYEFMDALYKDVPPRAKLNLLKKAADRINAAALPRSACRSGCSHCCNISAVINQVDADAIGRAIGIKPKKLKSGRPGLSSRERWFGIPCTFLVKGRCSIYQDRPIACRMMFNMADSPYFCDTRIPPDESHVTMLNLKQLEEGYVKTFIDYDWGDIRDFFPPKNPVSDR